MASPFEKFLKSVNLPTSKGIGDKSWGEIAYGAVERAPFIGPVALSGRWAATDPDGDKVPDYNPRNDPRDDRIARAALQQNMRANANQAAMARLREIVAEAPTLTNQEMRIRARKQVNPLFRPRIRETKRTIRQTEKQGRVSARQVQGYYDQAGQKVAGMAKGSQRSARRAAKKTLSGGNDAESRIAAQAIKGSGKANARFFKQMQGALAGEGAVAAADTRRNYKQLANEYRSNLAELRSERAAAMQTVVSRIRNRIDNTARSVYENTYLGAVQNGMAPRKAQKIALAQAGTYSDAIQGKAANLILKNKGNEKLLARLQKPGVSEEQFDRKMDMREQARKEYESLMKDANAAYDRGDETKGKYYERQAQLLRGGA